MSLTKLPTVTKVFLALVILCLSSGVLPGQPKEAGKTITVPATVQSIETVEIFSLVTGHLAKQTVDIGDRVKKGQVLAEIDAPILVKEVQQAEATLQQANAQLIQAEKHVRSAAAILEGTKSWSSSARRKKNPTLPTGIIVKRSCNASRTWRNPR